MAESRSSDSRRRPSRARTLLRAVSLGILACAAGGCFVSRRVAVAPTARRTDVRITFAEPRDLVVAREGADSLLLPGVRRLEGRLDRFAGDTLLMRSLTVAELARGSVDPGSLLWTTGARIAPAEGMTVTRALHEFSGQRTVWLAVGVAVVVGLLAAAASQIPLGW